MVLDANKDAFFIITDHEAGLHTEMRYSKGRNNQNRSNSGEEEGVFISNDDINSRLKEDAADGDDTPGINVFVNDFESNSNEQIGGSDPSTSPLNGEGLLLLSGLPSHPLRFPSLARTSSSSSTPSILSSGDSTSDNSDDSDADDKNDSDKDEGNVSGDSCPPLLSSGDEGDDTDVSEDESHDSEEDPDWLDSDDDDEGKRIP